MTDRKRSIAGRTAAMAAMMLLIAGCQGALTTGGTGVGDSGSGASYLAAIRSDNRLPPLKADRKLERAAAQQAGFMASAGDMEHSTGWGKGFASRMKKNGIAGPAAENVAYGAMSPQKLFAMWMNSSGHRRNMLDSRFGHYGLGSATDGQGRRYWALVLAK